MIPPRIKEIEIKDNYCIKIIYITNEIKIFDMKCKLKDEFYKKLNNIEYFKLAKSVDTTIEWPNGEDIDPNELYEKGIDINI